MRWLFVWISVEWSKIFWNQLVKHQMLDGIESKMFYAKNGNVNKFVANDKCGIAISFDIVCLLDKNHTFAHMTASHTHNVMIKLKHT